MIVALLALFLLFSYSSRHANRPDRQLTPPQEIAKYFRGKDFMNAPWLFAEAYKYRRLRECFSLSKYWVDYGENDCAE